MKNIDIPKKTALIVSHASGDRISHLLATNLEKLGYDSVLCSGVRDAERIISNKAESDEPIDLVLINEGLYKSDATMTTEYIRDTYPKLPIVIAAGDWHATTINEEAKRFHTSVLSLMERPQSFDTVKQAVEEAVSLISKIAPVHFKKTLPLTADKLKDAPDIIPFPR